MSVMHVVMNKAQLKRYHSAIKEKKGFELALTKKQIQEASTADIPGSVPIALNKMQAKAFERARAGQKPLKLSFSQTQMSRKSGGFIPLVPLLLSALPGLLGAAPQILEGVKSGYENVAKLAGVPTGSGLNIHGEGLQIHGSGIDSDNLKKLEKFVEGSSLRIFGDSKKNDRKPKPHEIMY